MTPADRKPADDRPGPPPSADAIEAIAADWLALVACRPLTPAEQATLAAWLAAEPRHRAAYAELAAAWKSLDRLAEYPRNDDAPADPDFFTRRHPRPHASWLALGAAAAVILTSILWLSSGSFTTRDSTAVVAAANPSNLRRLPDGSLVELRSGSEIIEEFGATERSVRLVHGEAFFSVKKDPQRPFVVRAGAVSVRAVGTAFNVRLAPSAVEVLVAEGIVRLNPPTESATAPAPAGASDTATHLTAGQRVIVPIAALPAATAPVVETVSASELERALAWQDNNLIFESTPLAEAVRHFNRRNVRQLVVAHAEVDSLRISGRFRSDNLDGFLELLESSLNVAVTRRGDEIELGGRR